MFGAPLSQGPTPDRVAEMAINLGIAAASDGSVLDIARAILRPAFLVLALHELGRAVSNNLLLLAQAQRFEDRPAAEGELAALDELLRLARASRHVSTDRPRAG